MSDDKRVKLNVDGPDEPLVRHQDAYDFLMKQVNRFAVEVPVVSGEDYLSEGRAVVLALLRDRGPRVPDALYMEAHEWLQKTRKP